jgi:hypothetical protein
MMRRLFMIATRTMKGSAAAVAVLFLLAGCCSPGDKMHGNPPAAMARSFNATLLGTQEVPPTSSKGTGLVTATLDPDGTFHWNVDYGGLTGPATAAHFHGPAAPGTNAGVVVNIGGQGLASPMQGAAHLDGAQIGDLVAGRWYVNIHTAANPNGEIRGQIVPMQ